MNAGDSHFSDYAEQGLKETLTMYLIWSNQHQAWWRPNSRGYSRLVEGAGRYSHNEALDICRNARDGWKDGIPAEIPVSEDDALGCLLPIKSPHFEATENTDS